MFYFLKKNDKIDKPKDTYNYIKIEMPTPILLLIIVLLFYTIYKLF